MRLRTRQRQLFLALASGALFAPGTLLALPVAPTVVNGTAQIQQSGKVLTVTNSNGAIINWQQFNIAAGETTRFIQASASSSVLNRVLAGDPSVIYGTLSSNGNVWLINPAGIMVGAGGRIDVAGFVASTLNVTNADFLANRLKFDGAAGAGSVINQGSITTPLGGSVYLIGANVSNEGIITTPKGETILAAGSTVQLIDTATPGVKVELTGATGNVTNIGMITAEAGRIGIAGALVKNSGVLSASSAVAEGGRVFLRATRQIELTTTSKVGADGTAGGSVTAITTENGQISGELIARGEISAKGGGGFVETSAGYADIGGLKVEVSGGLWLIDPYDYTIDATAASSIKSTLDGGGSVTIDTTGNGGPGAGALGNGDITVASAIDKTVGADATLTLNAHNNINLNANITSTTGQLNMVFNPDLDSSGGGTVILGTTTLNANGGTINVAGKTVSHATGTATIDSTMLLGTLNLTGGTLAGAGAVTVSAGLGWSGGTLSRTGTTTLALGSTSNWSTGSLENTGALINAGTLSIDGTGTAYIWGAASALNNSGTILYTKTGGLLSFNAGSTLNNLSGGTIDLQSDFTINSYAFTGGNINNAGTITKTAGTSTAMSNVSFNHQGGSTLSVANPYSVLLNGGGSFAGTATGTGVGVTLNDGDWTSAAGAAIAGAWQWNAGKLTTGTLTNAGTLNINGTGTAYIWGAAAALNNSGTILYTKTGGLLSFNAGSTLNNLSGGTIDLQSDNTVNSYAFSGGNINNAGTVTKTAGTSTAISNVSFNHQGGSTLSVANPYSILLNGGGSFAGTSTGTGIGITLNGGNWTASSGATIAGAWQWNAGSLISGTLTNAGTLNINGTGESYISTAAATLNNSGTILYAKTGGGLLFNAGSTLNNLSGGIIDLQSDYTISSYAYTGGNIINAGVWQKTAGASTALHSSIAFSNTGTVKVQTGSLVVPSFPSNSGTVDIASGATFQKTGAFTNAASGKIAGAGTLDLGGATLTNSGTIRPGGVNSVGTLSITGLMTNSAGGTIEIELLDNSSQYDKIIATGNITLGGTIKANDLAGYQTVSSDTYSIINSSAGAVSGTPTFTSDTGGTYSGSGSPTFTMTATGAGATQYIWSGSNSNYWDDALNWTGSHIPISTELAVIDGAGIKTIEVRSTGGTQTVRGVLYGTTGGTDNLLLSSGSTLDIGSSGMTVPASSTLTINGGTLTATGSVTTNGTFSLNSGTLNGAGNVVVNGILSLGSATLSGSGTLSTLGTTTLAGTPTLSVQTWNQSGTLNIGGAHRVLIYNGGVLNNLTGGIINDTTTNAWPLEGNGSAATFTNSGTFNKNAGSAATQTFNFAGFSNAAGGTFSINSGTFQLSQGAATDSGTYNIGAGTTLSVTGGTRTFSGASFSGTGVLGLAGGIMDFATNTTFVTGGPTLLLTSGSLQGAGNVTINNALSLGGATLQGTGTLISSNTSTTTLVGTPVLSIKTWNQSGTLNIGGAERVLIYNGGVLNNLTGGIINDTTTNAWPLESNGSTATFTNSGTFNKNSGSLATQTFNFAGFSNAAGGTFSVNSGTFQLSQGAATDSGTYNIGAGTTLSVTGGTRTFSGASFSGTGVLGLAGGIMDFASNTTFVTGGPTLSLTNGILQGTGNLTIDNALSLGGATLQGTGTLISSSTSTTTLVGTPTLSIKTWNQSGTLNIGGAERVLIYNGGVLNNLTGGIINDTTTNAWPLEGNGSAATFTNTGTFNKNASSAATQSFNFAGFSNATGGTFSVNSGTFQLAQGAATDSGTYNIGAGATLSVTGGTRTFSGASFSGTGLLGLAGGTMDFATNTTFVTGGPTLSLTNGILQGTGNLTIDNALSLGGATLQGTGTLISSNTSTTTLVGTPVLSGKTWSHNGTLEIDGADRVLIYNGGVLNNLAGGIINDTTTNAWPLEGNGSTATFTNTGTFNKNAGSAATQSFNFAGFSNAAGGKFSVNSGTFQVGGSSPEAGTINVASSATFEKTGGFINTGTLTGSGTINIGASTLFNNGIIAPGTGVGGIGTLSITGDLNLTGGTFNIDVGGTSGGQSDTLAVTGNVTMGGTLNATKLAGYTPVNADAIPFLTMTGTASGTFSPATLPANFSAGYNLNANEGARLIFALAGTRTFNNSQSNLLWSDALNWTGGAPGAGDSALISGTFAVNHSSGTDTILGLTVDSGNSLAVSGGSLTVTGATSVGGALTVSGGTLTLNSTSTVATLGMTSGALNGSGKLTVDTAFNYSGGSVGLTGALEITHTGNLALPAMTTLAALLATATGDITLNGNIATAAADNSLVLAAGGNFLNPSTRTLSAGSNSGSDRWLVYSANPINIINKGGLTSSFRHYASTRGTYAPGSVSEAGNGFIYASAAGALTVATSLGAGTAGHVYGDAPTATYTTTLSGFSDAEDNSTNIGLVGTAILSEPNSTSNVNAYTVGYTSGLTSASGYTFAAGTGLAYSVTPAPLAVTANSLSKVYGDTVSFAGAEFSATGLKSGQTIGSVSFASSGAVAAANVGSSYLITPGAAVGGTFNPSNYSVTYVDGSLTVTPRPLSVAFVSPSKVYDGNVTATVGSATLSNVVAADSGNVTVTSSGALFDTRHVGTGKAVTYAGLTLGGSAASNYSLPASTTGSGTITQLASATWSGGNGNWSNAGNWGGVLPDGNNVLAVTIPSGVITYDLSGSTTINSISGAGASLLMNGTGALQIGTTSSSSSTLGGLMIQNGTLTGVGTLTSATPVQLQGGTLKGSFILAGSLSHTAGTVAAGTSPGTLAITGNYTMGSAAVLQIEVGGPTAGSSYDVVNVGGTAQLGGTLDVLAYNGYTPGSATRFDGFLTATGGVSGSFVTKNLPANYSLTAGSSQLDLAYTTVPSGVTPDNTITTALNTATTQASTTSTPVDASTESQLTSADNAPVADGGAASQSSGPIVLSGFTTGETSESFGGASDIVAPASGAGNEKALVAESSDAKKTDDTSNEEKKAEERRKSREDRRETNEKPKTAQKRVAQCS